MPIAAIVAGVVIKTLVTIAIIIAIGALIAVIAVVGGCCRHCDCYGYQSCVDSIKQIIVDLL